MRSHRHGTGRLSPDGNLVFVAAESSDVVLYPLERLPLVFQAEVCVARVLEACQQKYGKTSLLLNIPVSQSRRGNQRRPGGS